MAAPTPAAGSCVIEYNGKTFVVDAELFADASVTFRQNYDRQSRMVIEGDLPVEQFQEFLPAVQGGSVPITLANAGALHRWAEQWGVTKVLEMFERPEYSVEDLIRQFTQAAGRNDLTRCRALMPSIASRIDECLTHARFMLVPASLLEEIFAMPECKITHHSDLFGFVMAVVNARGLRAALPLLARIDTARLEATELGQVVANDRLLEPAAAPFLLACCRRLRAIDAEIKRALNDTLARIKQYDRVSRVHGDEMRAVEERINEERRQHQVILSRLGDLEPTTPKQPPAHARTRRRREGQRRFGIAHGDLAADDPRFHYVPPQAE